MARQLLPLSEGPGTAHRPHPRKLDDLASWSIGQLSSAERGALARLPPVLRLGTACSGSDCPAVVARRLAQAIRKETWELLVCGPCVIMRE